jgi:hypothetical protein
MDNIKIGSNKSFGIVFFVFFLILSLYPVFFNGEFRILLFVISITFLILGLFNSKILTPFNLLWFKFGIFLGRIVSPVIMGLVFYLVVTPTGLIMRMLNKDILNLKKKKTKSYWINRETSDTDMRNQF